MDWHLLGNGVAALECALILAWFSRIGVKGLRKLPVPVLIAFLSLASGTSIVAQKTNGVNNLPPMPMPPRSVPVVETVTDDDVARGWRVESVTTNETFSFAMPSNAVYVSNWHIHGARSSFGNNVIDLGSAGTPRPTSWSFPLGTNGEAFSSFWYFVDGRIRPTPKDAAREICAVGVPMSAVPGLSRLWTVVEDDDSRVLTWENLFLGGDTNAPVNAQIRLFANGDFTTRSNNVETVCRRVNPDDWDGDGLANEKDENPLAYDGDFFGVANAMPTNANLDAYYQLDVAAAGALDFATIRVTCDGPSDLGDHVVIARTNQVCHVPLLAGATYAVESDLPIAYSAVSSEHAHIITNSATELTVSLPLKFTVERIEMRGGGSDSYIVRSSPVNVGPRIANVSGVCCSCTTNETGFTWNCGADCDCGGFWHDPVVTATWGGYSRPFAWHGWCPCVRYGDDGQHVENPRLILNMTDTLFTNGDGGAEDSDIVRLSAGLFSPNETNGTLTLDVGLGEFARLWTTSNRIGQINSSVTWNVAEDPHRDFYVEGAEEIPRGIECFTLTWKDADGNTIISTNVDFAVYCPVLNVINNVLSDNGVLCNPSGIIVGTNACFALEFGRVHPPVSEIKWSVVNGIANFVDGNDEGERVRISSNVSGQRVTLRAQIGKCRSRPPEISACVVEPLSVKLTVWIVGNDDGSHYATDELSIYEHVAGVNKIYEQIGVCFYVDCIGYTNREEWLDIATSNGCNLALRGGLVNLSKNTGGLELYYVDKVSPRAIANHDDYGIVLSTNATAISVAHEIGHAFGCDDIFPVQKANPQVHIPDRRVCIDNEPLDWNNGTGCRYYSRNDDQEAIIRRLLMYGSRHSAKCDLSSGSVYGFNASGGDGLVDVGFFLNGTRRSLKCHK